jgi:hypothetical protein
MESPFCSEPAWPGPNRVEISSTKLQISNKFQILVSKDPTFFFCMEFGSLEFICYLAYLREAASAKAGACHLVPLLPLGFRI